MATPIKVKNTKVTPKPVFNDDSYKRDSNNIAWLNKQTITEKPKPAIKKEETIVFKARTYKKADCVKITEECRLFCGYEYAPKDSCVKNQFGDYILREIAVAIITKVDKDRKKDVEVEYECVSNQLLNKCVDTKNIHIPSYEEDTQLRSQIQALHEAGLRYVVFKDLDVLLNCGYVEDFVSGTIMHEAYYKQLSKDNTRVLADYQKFHNPITNPTKAEKIEFGMESPTFIKTEGNRMTYGIEVETIRGVVPEYVRHKYNMCAKFDGSLRLEDGSAHGAEYITGVLKGDAGLIHIYKIINELSKRCAINKLCSVHCHVGSVDFNQEFIVYMYKLALLIEDEMFAMVPYSRSKSEYCQRMRKIDLPIRDDSHHEIDVKNAFEKIRSIINVVNPAEDYKISKKKEHPLGRCCGYKKETPRYWWLNLVPAMYNIRGDESYTVEFRLHSATLNYKKVENLILICLGIVEFVENHKRMIKPGITLGQIMKVAYPKNGNNLAEYIEKRKATFSNGSTALEGSEYSIQENKADTKVKTKKQILTDVHNSV